MFEIKTKDLKLELKVLGDTGEFEGLAAVYDVKDDLGDVIEHGAFARTLHHRGGKVPMLWNHQMNEVIGFGDLADSQKGLVIKGHLNLEITRAREIHALMKQAKAESVPFGLSIGYDAINPKWEGDTRHLKEIRLWEVSPTIFPAQSMANVSAVKSRGPSEGKPFGDFASFEECVAQNQDKDNPEGFCAFLHQQMTGQWPGDKSRWQARIDALFARTKSIRLSREEVATFCASCAEKMATNGLATIIITPSMAKHLPEQLLQGIADGYSEQKAFFADCVDHPPADVDDPESFCAWLQEQCSGGFPAEVATVVQGVRYLLQTIALPSVRTLATKSYGLDGSGQQLVSDATGHLQQGLMALMVLLLSESGSPSKGEHDRRSVQEPEVYRLSQLMREMQSAMRLRQVEPV